MSAKTEEPGWGWATMLLAMGAIASDRGNGVGFHGGMEVGGSGFVAAYIVVGLIVFVVPLVVMMVRKRPHKWRGHDVPEDSEPYLT